MDARITIVDPAGWQADLLARCDPAHLMRGALTPPQAGDVLIYCRGETVLAGTVVVGLLHLRAGKVLAYYLRPEWRGRGVGPALRRAMRQAAAA